MTEDDEKELRWSRAEIVRLRYERDAALHELQRLGWPLLEIKRRLFGKP